MSLPQFIHYNVGGTISVNLDDRPTNALVTVFDGQNGTRFANQTGTISTINTTLAAAANKGDYSISVAANTGFSVGSTCMIQDDPEEILVQKVAGTTISLRRPLMNDHIDAAEVEGTLVSYNVTSAQANTLFWDGRAEWNIDGAVKCYTSVECTKYPFSRSAGGGATAQDLLDEEPKLYHLKDRELDLERMLDNGLEVVLSRIASAAPDLRGRVYPGSSAFKRATVLAAIMGYYRRQRGDEARELWERYRQELESEIARVCQTTPRDADQDGEIESDERISYNTISLRRG